MNLKDGLYLVKVPNLVFNHINKLPHNALIGHISNNETILLNKKRQNPFKITLEGNISAKNFELSIDEAYDTFTFKENKPKVIKINKSGRFIAKDESISDMLTQRIQKEEENKKTVTMIEMGKGRPTNEGIIKLSDHQFYATNDNKEKAILQMNRKDNNLKKTRKDKDELMNDIFDLFSDKRFWTLKELVDKLDQPENFLKEELYKVCDYIKSGPQKGSFELKRQYELNNKENKDD